MDVCLFCICSKKFHYFIHHLIILLEFSSKVRSHTSSKNVLFELLYLHETFFKNLLYEDGVLLLQANRIFHL